MSDEYLWDRTGEPDPLVVELEGKLAGLAFEPVFLLEEPAPAEAPQPPPRTSGWRAYALGSTVTAAAVVCAVLLYWCGYRAGLEAPPVDPAAQPVVVGTPEASAPNDEPPSSVEPHEPAMETIADEVEDALPPEPRIADARDLDGKTKAKSKSKTKGDGDLDPVLLEELAGSSSGSSKGTSRPNPSSSSGSGSSSTSSKTRDVDADCRLDPNACGGSSSGSRPAGGGNHPSLPEKLSTTDIRDGIAPVKAAAKACGEKHGAEPGEKVKIKLSIAGATGTVTSARAEPPHTGTPLGICVEAALKRAKFKRFQKASLGAVYPFSM